MGNFIKYVNIHDFKTIKHCDIEACKRINLFIARSAIGASHIVEALSLFSIPFLRENTSKSITQFIRMESETELFYNGNFGEPVISPKTTYG